MLLKNKPDPDSEKHDPYAAVRIGEFRVFLFGRIFMTLAYQMIDIIIYQQVYELTKNPLLIGFIGLAQAIPIISIALYAGHIADRRNRRNIIIVANFLVLCATIALIGITYDLKSFINSYGLMAIYGLVFIIGMARGFLGPATFSLLGQIVHRDLYASASTWNSSVWQTAAVLGPAIGGLCYAHFSSGPSYGIACAFLLVSILMFLFLIKSRPSPKPVVKESLRESILSGIKFVFRSQIILGALTLDLFAVLFGGVVALLPFFANDILHTNAVGLGLLKAAPAFGSVMVAIVMVYIPQKKNAGRNLLFCVFGFGLCMIFFGLSHSFVLSISLLVLSGIFDNVSVVIRNTTLQLKTPDHMRGRVSAVNSIFIGSSNEIGAVESGVAARLMGIIPSVIFGGLMTLGVVGVTAWRAPELRKLDLTEMKEDEEIIS